MMSPFIVLLLWMAASPLLFVLLPARRAVIACFVVGWLVLPKGTFPIAGLPDVGPSVAIAIGVLIGIMLVDPAAFIRVRYRWIDLFALTFVVVPFASALSNGLGPYEGLSAAFSRSVTWGVPYLCGRAYIQTIADVKELATAITVGVLVYLPFCIWEMRMSPTLHYYTYGFRPFKFHTTRRFGGYRPVVYLSHGVEMGMWITAGAIMSFTLLKSRLVRFFYGVPFWTIVAAIFGLLVLSRALGAWLLSAAAAGTFLLTLLFKSRIIMLVFVLLPIFYVGARTTDLWNGGGVVDAISVISPTRAVSLNSRLYHERRLKDRALERPLLGWGGWGRQRVRDETGKDTSVTDGFWVIVLGQSGLIGLIGWLGMFAGPGIVAVWRCKASTLTSKPVLPIVGMILLISILAIDLMLNAFIGPSLIMMSGAVVSLTPLLQRAGKARPTAYRAPSAPVGEPVAG